MMDGPEHFSHTGECRRERGMKGIRRGEERRGNGNMCGWEKRRQNVRAQRKQGVRTVNGF